MFESMLKSKTILELDEEGRKLSKNQDGDPEATIELW